MNIIKISIGLLIVLSLQGCGVKGPIIEILETKIV
jgi:predicted small lipoprotein YifL|tara:strand:+ start:1434 stop:1538 length:105 start_codon:yes stop_codon:yes gene_type:complete